MGRLAVGIANLVTVLWPERVVVGGGVAAAGDQLFGPLRAAVAAAAPLVDPASYTIVPGGPRPGRRGHRRRPVGPGAHRALTRQGRAGQGWVWTTSIT